MSAADDLRAFVDRCRRGGVRRLGLRRRLERGEQLWLVVPTVELGSQRASALVTDRRLALYDGSRLVAQWPWTAVTALAATPDGQALSLTADGTTVEVRHHERPLVAVDAAPGQVRRDMVRVEAAWVLATRGDIDSWLDRRRS